MLAKDWSERKEKHDVVVVGSGYGGAILAQYSPAKSSFRIPGFW